MMARPERFELPTPAFVARYSIQMSYGRPVLITHGTANNLRCLGEPRQY